MRIKQMRNATILVVMLSVGSSVIGQDGMSLMKVEPAARPSGMGGAFVSIAGDPNSAPYNPAGAVSTPMFAASFGHNTHWENVRLETGYVAAPLTEHLFIHGGIRFASVDDIEGRLTPTLEPDGLFEAKDISLKSGLAFRFNGNFSAGFGVGWFIEKIGAWRGSAFNVDVGAHYSVSEDVSIGASATNIGSSFTLGLSGETESREISLPTTYRVGGSYRYDKYLGALDVVHLDDRAHLHAGLEADLHKHLSIRSGYMFNYDTKNFTAGASFSRRNLTIDYAFVPYTSGLGTSHLFNLSVTL